MKPDISIVTPSFRQLEWLKLCAASVADQTGVTHEHIVQDAGTGPELEAWAKSRPLLRLYVEKDSGMYDAVNRGLLKAEGSVCAYLNCDEQYLPGALEKVVKWFEQHSDIDVLFGDGIVVDAEGIPLAYRRVIRPTPLHTRLLFAGTLTCSMFFRRSVVERGLLFDPAYRDNGDAVWVYSVLAAGLKVGTLPEPLAVFTLTGANMSLGENPRREYQRWNSQPDAPPRWLKPLVTAWHRCKKLIGGAYSPRDVRVPIYTHSSGSIRQVFEVSRLTPRWPTPRDR